MIRVMHLIPTLEGGGAEGQLRMLLARSRQNAIETALLANVSPGVADVLRRGGTTIFPFVLASSYDPRLILHIQRAIGRFRPHIVQTWLPQMDILGGAIALANRIPWVLSERSSEQAYPSSTKNRIRAKVGRLADAVIANSAGGMDYWTHPRSLVIPNGLDFTRLNQQVAVDPPLKIDLTNRRIVISTGRLSIEKRTDIAISAIDIVRRSEPAVLLLVAGAGPEEGRLRSMVGSLGLESHVYFTGYHRSIWAIMKRGEIGLSSSAFEGHPNAVLEAAALGLPQILSDIPAHRQALGDAAIYCQADDPVGFADAVTALLECPERGREFAAAALRHVAPLSIDVIAARYAAFYREVLTDRRTGRT